MQLSAQVRTSYERRRPLVFRVSTLPLSVWPTYLILLLLCAYPLKIKVIKNRIIENENLTTVFSLK
jgi:hypothetical protein